MAPDIWFYNLGIRLYNIDRAAIRIGGFGIYWYGILITLGVILAYLLAVHIAKKTDQDPEHYSDMLFWVVPAGAIGARLYYIAFSDQTLADLFNLRGGGLAFFGLVLGGIPAAYYVAKKHKIYVPQALDTAIMGVLVGQIIGRFGNFINREAYGRHTDSLFALRYRVDQLLMGLPADLHDTIVTYNGVQYIQVHPTFLYEVFSNTAILIFLYLYHMRKKFEGELICLYFVLHGGFRFFWEGLRADSLMMGPLRVSQVVALGMVAVGLAGLALGYKKGRLIQTPAGK